MRSSICDLVNLFFIPLVIGVLSIGLPLMFQIVIRIDDKYHSTRLTEVFYKEKSINCSFISLIFSIFFIFVWFFRTPRYIDLGVLNLCIDHSAYILLFISVCFLLVSIFIFVFDIIVYCNPNKLLNRLINKYKVRVSDDKVLYFHAISDIFYYSIKQEDEVLSRSLLEFFSDIISDFGKDKKGEIIVYPKELYDTIIAANELLFLRGNRTVSNYNNAILIEFLIDDVNRTIISEDTFTVIWKSFRQALDHNKEDVIFSYWKKAHQYFEFVLNKDIIQYGKGFKVLNKELVENHMLNKERFKEFNYALGGLLMQNKKFSLLSKLMNHTNTQPPRFLLVPNCMSEVVKEYIGTKINNLDPFSYETRYSFPNAYGVNGGSVIRKWIKKYLALLFLRQYTLHEYCYRGSTIKMPDPPTNLLEMKYWCKQLEILEKDILEIIKNKTLLVEIDFSFSELDWFENNSKDEPSKLINDLIKEIKKNYGEKMIKQSISKDKRDEFIHQTNSIIGLTLKEYNNIFQNKNIGNEKFFSFEGISRIMDKKIFADSDSNYLDGESYVANCFSNEIRISVARQFSKMKSRNVLLKKEDVFNAIDKLLNKVSNIVIVSFDVDLYDFVNRLKVNNLKFDPKTNKFSYKNIEIISLPTVGNQIVSNSFFVLDTSSLPIVEYGELKQETIEKYSLEEINPDFHLYANIIDLNKREDLRLEINKNDSDSLKESVLVYININMKIQWTKSINMFQIKVFNQFSHGGNINVVNEVNW